jgi:hypothetical protein
MVGVLHARDRDGALAVRGERETRCGIEARRIRSVADAHGVHHHFDSALARAHRGQVAIAAAVVAAARADRRTALALRNPIAAYSLSGDAPRQLVMVDQPLGWLLQRGSRGAAGNAGIGVALADSTQLLAEVARQARSAFFTASARTAGSPWRRMKLRSPTR